MYAILILDDDEHVLKALQRLLRDPDYGISAFQDPHEAHRQCLTRQFDLILSDQRMPGMTGTELFSKVRETAPHTRRILISGYTDFTSVTDAFNAGVIHKFVLKPWDNNQLKALVREQLELGNQHREEQPQPTELTAERRATPAVSQESFHGILTRDPAMQQQIELIRKTARSDAALFIHGETGTGKELVARAIHLESERSDKNFVALNCANLT